MSALDDAAQKLMRRQVLQETGWAGRTKEDLQAELTRHNADFNENTPKSQLYDLLADAYIAQRRARQS